MAPIGQATGPDPTLELGSKRKPLLIGGVAVVFAIAAVVAVIFSGRSEPSASSDQGQLEIVSPIPDDFARYLPTIKPPEQLDIAQVAEKVGEKKVEKKKVATKKKQGPRPKARTVPKCDDAFYEYWKPLENMPEEFSN